MIKEFIIEFLVVIFIFLALLSSVFFIIYMAKNNRHDFCKKRFGQNYYFDQNELRCKKGDINEK